MVPKLHDMMKFELTIPRFGSAAITSTAFGEAAHKHLKAAAAYTNRHAATMEAQVCKNVGTFWCIQQQRVPDWSAHMRAGLVAAIRPQGVVVDDGMLDP